MSVSFIVVSILTVALMAFSLLLLFFPKKVVCRFRPQPAIDRPEGLPLYRAGGLIGIGLCALVIGLYLVPHRGVKDIAGHFYFSKYIKNSPSPQADIYAIQAFNSWRLTGNVKSLTEAAEKLPMDSLLWSDFLRFVGDGYKKRGWYEQYGPFLQQFEGKITHPAGRMALFFQLGEWYLHRHMAERARDYFYKVIAINSDPFLMDQASGHLHAIDMLNPGQKAPDFDLKDTHGKHYSLDSLQGNVVVLLFWRVDCPGCKKEMPIYKKMVADLRTDKLVILGITTKRGEETNDYIEKEQLQWPQVVLDEERYAMIQQSYSIQYIPNNYVIGADGKIAAKQLKPKELEAKIRKLLQSL